MIERKTGGEEEGGEATIGEGANVIEVVVEDHSKINQIFKEVKS